jgi:hypothetical protein
MAKRDQTQTITGDPEPRAFNDYHKIKSKRKIKPTNYHNIHHYLQAILETWELRLQWPGKPNRSRIRIHSKCENARPTRYRASYSAWVRYYNSVLRETPG